jgi:hypothetical protein
MTRISTYGGIELSGFGQLTFLKFWMRLWGEPFMPPIANAQVAYQLVKNPSIISCNL